MNDHILDKYVSLEQLRFNKLSDGHTQLLRTFESTNSELRDFLVEDALRQQKMCVSSTSLVFDSVDFARKMRIRANPALLGYVTVTNDCISLSSDMKQTFQEKGVNYKSLPALKIGRLCVDTRYRKRGIGRLILAHWVLRAVKLNVHSACRFITLDAKRSRDKVEDSLHFYRRYGFDVLPHKDKSREELMKQNSGETPVFLDIYHIAKRILQLNNP